MTAKMTEGPKILKVLFCTNLHLVNFNVLIEKVKIYLRINANLVMGSFGSWDKVFKVLRLWLNC